MIKKDLLICLFVTAFTLSIALSSGLALAAYPGPDEGDGTNNMIDDSRGYVETWVTGTYYQGLTTKYNDVSFHCYTDHEDIGFPGGIQPAGGASVCYCGETFNTGWYTFPGYYYNGQGAGGIPYECDGYNVNSAWVSSSTTMSYIVLNWGWPVDSFTVGATATITASA